MSRRTTIGVVAPQLSGLYFGTLLESIHAVTQTYYPRLIGLQGSPRDIVTTRVGAARIDGWIVINTTDGLAELAQTGVPLVTIGAQAPDVDCPAVFPDNVGGMQTAVQHLFEHGHREIAFIGNLANTDIRERYHGYLEALAAVELVPDQNLVTQVDDNSEQSGADALQRILETGTRCTAVVCATDENALGVLAAAQAAGLGIPDDLAVVSFDDIILAHGTIPPLTTVRVPLQAVGGTAARLLLDVIAGREAPGGATRVTTALMTRRSCGCNMGTSASALHFVKAAEQWTAVLSYQLVCLASHPQTA